MSLKDLGGNAIINDALLGNRPFLQRIKSSRVILEILN